MRLFQTGNLKIVAGAVILSMIFSPSLFVGIANAANPKIVLHVPPRIPTAYRDLNAVEKLFAPEGVTQRPSAYAQNSVQLTEQNLIDGAAAISPKAKAQMEAALENDSIIVDPKFTEDIETALKDTSYLEVDGKTVAKGKDAIQAYFKKLAEENTKAPATDCVFMVPGLTDNNFTPPKPPANVTTKGAVTGYGPRFSPQPASAKTEAEESELNQALRSLGPISVEQRWDAVIKDAGNDTGKGAKKVIVYLPGADQAWQYFLNGSYKVNGTDIPLKKEGTKYTAGVKDDNGLYLDDECNPTKGPAPKEPGTPGSNPFMPGTQPGNFTPGGAPQGPGSGLESLLPLLLMQSLLGGQGGLGGKNGLGNQGGNMGTGNNGYTNTTTNTCALQGIYPVCGSDGKTYNNLCWMHQFGAIQVSTGVCNSAPSPTPIAFTCPSPQAGGPITDPILVCGSDGKSYASTQICGLMQTNQNLHVMNIGVCNTVNRPNNAFGISTAATQLLSSGAPQSVINAILSRFASIFGHLSGQAIIQ